MSSRITMIALTTALGAGLLGFTASIPAFAQTAMQQCSTKYQAAKAANSLNGQTWQAFLAQCRADAAAPANSNVAPAAAPAPTPAVVAPKPPVVATPVAPKPPVVVPPVIAPVAGAAVFPTAIAPAYASLSAGVARRKTCDDQYKANKATNGNGGLEWIQKGGGYYSECNKKLKGL